MDRLKEKRGLSPSTATVEMKYTPVISQPVGIFSSHVQSIVDRVSAISPSTSDISFSISLSTGSVLVGSPRSLDVFSAPVADVSRVPAIAPAEIASSCNNPLPATRWIHMGQLRRQTPPMASYYLACWDDIAA
jgi:hypothetical protein